MSRFKKNLVILVIYILLISSTIQFSHNLNFIEFGPYFFATLTLAVVATILIPFFERHSSFTAMGFWMVFYLLVWLATDRTLTGNRLVTLLVELAFLSIGVAFTREMTLAFREMEKTIDKLIFANFSGRARMLEDAAEEIQTELARSRRYNRPLSLVIIEPDPSIAQTEFQPAPREIQQHLTRRYVMAQIAEIIDREARRTDIIIKQSKPDRFIVICPETQSSNTNTLIRRVVEKTRDQIGVLVGFGVVSFPEEALTFEELLQKAEQKMIKPGAYTMTEGQSPVKVK